MSESDLLRLALLQLFDEAAQSPRTSIEPPVEQESLAVPDDTHLTPKTVWMPAFLMRAACQRAEEKGMSFSRWASSLFQSNLMRLPVLTDTELRMVDALTRELAALGRNINQVARTLDEAYFDTDRIRLDKLAELSATITGTRNAIGRLVRASRRSWRAK